VPCLNPCPVAVGSRFVRTQVVEVPHLEVVTFDGGDVVKRRCLTLEETDTFSGPETIQPVHRVGWSLTGGGLKQIVAAQILEDFLCRIELFPSLFAFLIQFCQPLPGLFLLMAITAQPDPLFAQHLTLGCVRIDLSQAELPQGFVGHLVATVLHVAVGAGRSLVVALGQRF